MELFETQGRRVKITLKNGKVFQGQAYDYTSALDNEPDPASITIDSVELYEPEIAKIELIE